MKISDNIILTGPMAVGKTQVGQCLAWILGRPFYDLDYILVQKFGKSLIDYFFEQGELSFRQQESLVLQLLKLEQESVIATGGGTVLKDKNRNIIKKLGKVFYLTVNIFQQYKRTRIDNFRPLLKGSYYMRIACLRTLNKVRHPYYLDVADVIIPTDNLVLFQVVFLILKNL